MSKNLKFKKKQKKICKEIKYVFIIYKNQRKIFCFNFLKVKNLKTKNSSIHKNSKNKVSNTNKGNLIKL